MRDKNITPLEYACMTCDTVMETLDAAELPPPGRFHYRAGVFLSGMERCYWKTGRKAYHQYIQKWVDSIVNPDGSIRDFIAFDGKLTPHRKGMLDDLQPAVLLFRLYEETGCEQYKNVIERFCGYIKQWPTNPLGGFWHMDNKENQMWLDGLYMAGPLMTRYGAEQKDMACFDLMIRQAALMRDHMRDETTGLYYHAWDFSKKADWADPESGCSPEFWGRAIGWFAAAILDMLDFVPEGVSRRGELVEIVQELLQCLPRYQDKASGMWYQVTNKLEAPDNWVETTCTCLFTYALLKACRKGYLPESYAAAAQKGYEGVLEQVCFEKENRIELRGVCAGTCVGDYSYYVNRPRVVNDLHGMGAFVLMCTEAAEYAAEKRRAQR